MDAVTPEYLSSYLNVTRPNLQKVDLAFLFGSPRPEPAQIAAELFHAKKVSKILATGGGRHKTPTKQPESEYHRDILLNLGIPKDCIIVENKSENTLENVLFAKEVLNSLNQKISNLVIICRWFHCRRALMTIKAQMPLVTCYTHSYDSILNLDGSFNLNQMEKAKVEYQKIQVYLAKGDLAEIDP